MIASTPCFVRCSAAGMMASNAAAYPSGVSERTPTPFGMKCACGYIRGPSSGTLSSAWGTTNPIFFVIVASVVRVLFNALGASGFDHFAPSHELGLHEGAQFLRRAGEGSQAQADKALLGLRRFREFNERLVELRNDRRRRACRGHDRDPGAGIVVGDA